jgi:hypothetical protein
MAAGIKRAGCGSRERAVEARLMANFPEEFLSHLIRWGIEEDLSITQGQTKMPGIRMARVRASILILCTALTCSCHSPDPSPRPLLREDLRQYGYLTQADNGSITNFTNLNFLSDDLVLVAMNQVVEPSLGMPAAEQRRSELLLFEIQHQILLRRLDLALPMKQDSIKSTRDGGFIAVTKSGTRLCSAELKCTDPTSIEGPILVSPRGLKVAVDGPGHIDHRLLESVSLKEVQRFVDRNISIIPGDGLFVVQRDRKLYLNVPGQPEQCLPFSLQPFGVQAQFLNDKTIAVFDSDTSLAIATLGGDVLSRIQVLPWWDGTKIFGSASGSRFGVYETGYTRWDEALHWYDIKNSRPRNLERIVVTEITSGKRIFEINRDPRPFLGYPVVPAMSPSGRSIATIYRGKLEVYEIN